MQKHPEIASSREAAHFLRISEGALAQHRYRGTGPKFIKLGRRRVIYRWSDIYAYIDANTMTRTDDPRATAPTSASA